MRTVDNVELEDAIITVATSVASQVSTMFDGTEHHHQRIVIDFGAVKDRVTVEGRLIQRSKNHQPWDNADMLANCQEKVALVPEIKGCGCGATPGIGRQGYRGSRDGKEREYTGKYRVECQCGRCGPWTEDNYYAVEAWNDTQFG